MRGPSVVQKTHIHNVNKEEEEEEEETHNLKDVRIIQCGSGVATEAVVYVSAGVYNVLGWPVVISCWGQLHAADGDCVTGVRVVPVPLYPRVPDEKW